MNHRNRLTDGPGQPTGAALFRQAQAGCRDSLARLMAAHEGLVQVVVRKQALGHLPFAEALQAGRIGLWRAILGFDPERGYAFSTYAWVAICRHIHSRAKELRRDVDGWSSHSRRHLASGCCRCPAARPRRPRPGRGGLVAPPAPRRGPTQPTRRQAGPPRASTRPRPPLPRGTAR